MAPKPQSIAPPAEMSITEEKWHDWTILVLTGKFVVKTFPLVRKAFSAFESTPKTNIALDLTHVVQIDSSALSIMLNFQKKLQETGGSIVIMGPNSEIKDTLLIVGFNLAVPMYTTRVMFEKTVTD